MPEKLVGGLCRFAVRIRWQASWPMYNAPPGEEDDPADEGGDEGMAEIVGAFEHLIGSHGGAGRQADGDAEGSGTAGVGKAGEGEESETAGGVACGEAAPAFERMIVGRVVLDDFHVRDVSVIAADLGWGECVGGRFPQGDECGCCREGGDEDDDVASGEGDAGEFSVKYGGGDHADAEGPNEGFGAFVEEQAGKWCIRIDEPAVGGEVVEVVLNPEVDAGEFAQGEDEACDEERWPEGAVHGFRRQGSGGRGQVMRKKRRGLFGVSLHFAGAEEPGGGLVVGGGVVEQGGLIGCPGIHGGQCSVGEVAGIG